MHTNDTSESKSYHHICWGAVITGALISFGLAMLFCLFNSGVGLSAAQQAYEGHRGLLWLSLIWSLIGTFVIFFVGGSVTVKLAAHDCHEACKGMLLGFLAWVVALVLGMSLMPGMHGAQYMAYEPEDEITMKIESVPAPAIHDKKHAAHEEPTVVQPGIENVIHQEIKGARLMALSGFLMLLAGALGSTIGAFYTIRYGYGCCVAKLAPKKRK